MIVFACTGCGDHFRVAERLAGRKVACKECGTALRVPTPEPGSIPLEPRPAPGPEVNPHRAGARGKETRGPGTIERDAWVSLAIGLGMALVALSVPLIGFVLDILVTVIHELGHTATSWLFAGPALPSFDLTYGGGYTLGRPRHPLLVVVAYAALGYLAFRERDDRPRLIAAIVGLGLYTVVMFTPLRDLAIKAMGYGSELLFAGIFLDRVLSGHQVLRGGERPLYAFLGLYMILFNVRFAFRLMNSPEAREAYGEAKGGGHWMDFEVIANDYLHWRLEVVAALFLVACLLTPATVWLAHRYRHIAG